MRAGELFTFLKVVWEAVNPSPIRRSLKPDFG